MARHPWVAKADGGVRFGIQTFQLRGSADPMPGLLAAARLVEQLGFDAFCLGDHPARVSDPWTVLAAISQHTERVMLGSVVNCVFYRNPAYLARVAADLDHLSRGRVMLGLGVGWDEGEFRALSAPFMSAPKRQAALEEALTIIRGVWGDEPFSYRGRYFSVESVRVEPGQFQERIPLMIAGGGERRTLRQVAGLADACNFGPGAVTGEADEPQDVRRKLEFLKRHCDELGRDYAEILRTYFTGWLILAPDRAALDRKLARMFPEGVPARPGFLLIGTVDEIAAYYRARAAAGIQYFVVQVIDNTDHETLELLAREVAPRVA
jgi:alkanesulfonate monooxygenase SsuD/methylene tetrahydromethanopterin reductase-like flavin-dependent oxidoreductase (luciferase family)